MLIYRVAQLWRSSMLASGSAYNVSRNFPGQKVHQKDMH